MTAQATGIANKSTGDTLTAAEFNTLKNEVDNRVDLINNALQLNDTDVYWDDMRLPFTQAKVGVTSVPDFDYTNIGLLFPQNDATEAVYVIVQMPHDYDLGTDIIPHVHWQQSAATAVTWKMDYKWFENGSAIPADFTTITADTDVYTWVSGNLAQISSFPAIDGSSIDSISSILLIKIYRDDNTTTGDVLAFEFDIHYKKDSVGSSTATSK